jgi:hypothetical protein
MWLETYQGISADPVRRDETRRSFAHPPGGSQPTFQTMARYCHDADTYLDDLLRLVREEDSAPLRPLERCRQTDDLLALLRDMFEGPDPRTRYEAQRKLQLCRLLFDVDHCRSVRDGPRHRKRFEALLDERLWPQVCEETEIDVRCQFRPDRQGLEQVDVGAAPEEPGDRWRFAARHLPDGHGDRGVTVFHYHSRFKREAARVAPRCEDDGTYRVVELPRWPTLGRRSGSILSKMIRRGIGDPHLVQDLLGAMFIVGDRTQAHALERRLLDPLGGPFRWRDRLDTLTGERGRARLGARSAPDFRVLKKIVDILTEDATAPTPYLFSVEIQIYPLEDYLRTLYDAEAASHDAYKRRQFLHDLLPPSRARLHAGPRPRRHALTRRFRRAPRSGSTRVPMSGPLLAPHPLSRLSLYIA